MNIDVFDHEELNGPQLIQLQSLQPTKLVGRVIFKNYSEKLLFNTTYAFDGWIVRAPAFFSVFFNKKIKGWPARKMMWFLFYLFCSYLSSYCGKTQKATDPFCNRRA